MGLAYSGGTVQKIALDATNGNTLATDLVAALVTAGWTSSPISGGFSLLSATTSQGLSCIVEVTTSGATCSVQTKSADGAVSHTKVPVYDGGGAALIMYAIVNQYSFWLLIPGLTTGVGGATAVTAYYAGVPFLPEPVVPLVVNGASNATPIVITTTTDHNLTTGDFVFIDGVGGNTAANGHFAITVLSGTTFSLNSSVGNGDYTSGGYVGTDDRLSRCVYSGGTRNNVFPSSLRANPAGTGRNMACITINEVNFAGTDSDFIFYTSNGSSWRDTRYTITEPYAMVPLTAGGSKFLQFQLWNAALISGSPQVTIDTLINFDGHSWHTYGSNSTLALVVAYT